VPKQVFKLEGFHGGLNSNSDPRDIREIESPSLQDIAIDSVGKIKPLGGFNDGNVFHSGTVVSAPVSNLVVLASSASSSDDTYNGYSLFITGGTGIGQERLITGYTGSSKVAVISSAWSTTPNNTSTYEIRGDSNETSILQNRGLFVMSSDRQLDSNAGDELLIFLYDNDNHTIDVKDSEGWDTALIDMGGSSTPVFYAADRVVRVSDIGLTRDSQWFGYIEDVKFYDSATPLNAEGPASAWVNVDQALATPTSGKCLISTSAVGTDTDGIFSANSEYIGDVINGVGTNEVVNHSAVNLRTGIQLNEIIFNSSNTDWLQDERCALQANDLSLYPCIGTEVTRVQGNSTTKSTSWLVENGLEFSFEEGNSIIVPIFITSSEINKLVKFQIEVGKTNGSGEIGGTELQLPTSTAVGIVDKTISATGIRWDFSEDKFKPDMWNFLVCSSDNITTSNSLFPLSECDYIMITMKDRAVLLGGGGPQDKMDYYISGIALTDSQSISAFTPSTYTFHHTYLYDTDTKQESLPFKFNDVDTNNVNSFNIIGHNLLFNFDTYICPYNSNGGTYSLNKRIGGSRLYYKKEDNDNYFLIGELDFIENGFKFLPEADTLSYSITDTSNTTGNILSKTALIKSISPETANIIDTFKSINGFSSEVKTLNAQYKTAVIHGRRVYIGNIKQNNKTFPDRIIKSQVNKFDTFPEGIGSVDVVINDGENIVKLEAYADRILQFKENSLYIINVSENVEFLEDTFRNKGCAFDYHVTKTDIGIAWFNIHGCYLYNGRNVIDLLEKQGIRLISEEDWIAFITDGVDGSADDIDMSSALIGYIPKKKELIIKNENNDIYLYDFVLQAWTTGDSKVTESTAMTNFALDKSQNLFYVDNTTTIRKTWIQDPESTSNLLYKTPDMDFGQPSIRKKIYRVRINYKGDASALGVLYTTNGDTDTYQRFEGTNSSTGKPTGSEDAAPLHNKTDLTQWHQAELKPSTIVNTNNIYSFQFILNGVTGSDFEVNDITIVYRMKNIK